MLQRWEADTFLRRAALALNALYLSLDRRESHSTPIDNGSFLYPNQQLS